EVCVASPSLMMLPRKTSSSRAAFIGSPMPVEGESSTAQLDWDVPPSLPPGNPLGAGPKCLVARCYPSSDAPAGPGFFVPGDQHVAQHNLCVVATSTTHFTFKFNTTIPRHPRVRFKLHRSNYAPCWIFIP